MGKLINLTDMKKITTFLILIIATTNLALAQKKKKAVFVIIDGIPSDVIKKTATPNLDKISAKGGFLDAYQGGEKGNYNQSPTISAVGYTNILTGTWYNKHNVPDNAIKNPNYHYRTIFRFLKDQYPDKKAAVFSSWRDNRTKLIGEGLSQTGNIKMDYHFDGLELDTMKYPHDSKRNFMARIDRDVATEAARCISENGPDLSWVYLEYTDDMGHMYGDSKQFYNAVRLEDSLAGNIWKAVQYRMKQYNEDWLIIVTTDHGRDAETGKGHGGQSDRERASWIATNAKDLNKYAKGPVISATDIVPTIARFMDIKIPANQQRELDGISIIGDISVSAPTAVKEGNHIKLSWQAIEKKGKVKIWLTTTNNFRESGEDDQYQLIAEVPLNARQYEFQPSVEAGFYKLVFEGPHNMVNRWIIK